jgi:hypothetical protein
MGGFKIIPFLVGVVVVCILIASTLASPGVESLIGRDDGSAYQRGERSRPVSGSERTCTIRVGSSGRGPKRRLLTMTPCRLPDALRSTDDACMDLSIGGGLTAQIS